MTDLLTVKKRLLVERNKAIIKEYKSLIKKNGAMKTEIMNKLCERYNLKTRASIYRILKHNK